MKAVLSVLALLAIAWAGLVMSGAMAASAPMLLTWAAAAVGVIGAAASWRAVARRRERQRLEAMRDSALW
jgi:membrane associated rhomboid family serine protease